MHNATRFQRPVATGETVMPADDGRDAQTLMRVRDLCVSYSLGWRRSMRAVAGVSLDIEVGSTVALIGESGSGKSSFAKTICGLGPLEAGTIEFVDQDVTQEKDRASAVGNLGMAIVFQDPTLALDPRWPVWRSISEPRIRRFPAPGAELRSHAQELARRVGLDASMIDRRPHQLSGGQRQRVTIARALAGNPRLVVLDEAISALDVSVRNEILGLLERLQREDGLTYLLISHDMGAVVQIATKIAVLYLGKLVEVGEAATLVNTPAHPYTRALLDSVPTLDGHRLTIALEGETGDPAHPPSGCRFHPRCPHRITRCTVEEPVMRLVEGRDVACHRTEEIIGAKTDIRN